LAAATSSVGSATADRSVTTDVGAVRVTGTHDRGALSEFSGNLFRES